MAMLEIRNVQKTFRTYAKPGLFHRPGARQAASELPVLRGVDLTVEKGDVVAILGPSGSGKTTLLRCLNFLETADAGQLVFDGESFDLAHASRADIARLRKKTAFVFQNYNLFRNKTALQNVTEGLIVARKLPKEQADEIGMKMLAKVGLADRADYYPRQLSGGQQQRVAIARALASNPKVLLCDEATSALDPATTRSILELLKDINRRLGLTILLITHEMDVVKRICDCVAVISNGQLIEQDTVSEVFSHPKTPLAQQFIQSTLHLDIPDDYQARLKPTATADSVPMLRMEFTGHSVDAPLLSETARRFNVNNNIISAQMDYAGGVKFGIMLTEMHGTQEDTQAAIAWLQEHHVKVEVLGYV